MLDRMFLEKNDKRWQEGRLCRVASKLILSFSAWSCHRRALVWTYDNPITYFCAEAKLMFILTVQWLIISGQSMAAKQWNTILVIGVTPSAISTHCKAKKTAWEVPWCSGYLSQSRLCGAVKWGPTFPCGFCSLSLVIYFAGSLNEL